MCFNAPVSLLTFGIGMVFSMLLITNSFDRYHDENKMAGIIFIFISMIQLMDFFLWIDLKNDWGINRFIGTFGPFLNVLQPTIIYLIKYVYYGLSLSTLSLWKDIGILGINILYVIYFCKDYIKYILSSNRLTTVVDHHLQWAWLKHFDHYFNPYFYLFVFTINIFYMNAFNYSIILWSIIAWLLYISYAYFKRNIGELWCFFGAFLPVAIYIFFWFG